VSPCWQFWTDEAIKLLGILATLFLAVVALFGARIRYRLDPPRLNIALARNDGWPATLHVLEQATNTAALTDGLWYHARVDNLTRWNTVTGVHVFLISIEVPDVEGNFQIVWTGDAALGWRHDPNPAPKAVGYAAECDLCHVLRGIPQVRLSPIIRGQVQDAFNTPLRMALTLQARGVDANSNLLRVVVSWDGQWSNNRDDMRRHLVVRADP
jgi:hypothetical protein